MDLSNYKLPQENRDFANERQELIQKFVDAINRERKGTKFKQVTWPQINGKLSFMGESELYIFFKECQDYRGPFSKRFYGGFKKQDWK